MDIMDTEVIDMEVMDTFPDIIINLLITEDGAHGGTEDVEECATGDPEDVIGGNFI